MFHRSNVATIAIVCLAGIPCIAHAQETISDQVWLGSALFTIEDLENLTDAAKLSDDQRDAALELMRGGMARARTMALRSYRGTDDWDWSDMSGEDSMAKMKEWQDKQKKQQEEVVEVEKSVMNDLKTLLEPTQVDDGWPKFERSRRRLLLRSVSQVQQHVMQLAAQAGESMEVSMSYSGYGMDSEVPDLIATIRAAKLSKADMDSIATVTEQYATSMDALIKDYRGAAKTLLKAQQGFMGFGMGEEQAKPSEGDIKTIQDVVKRMGETHIKYAHQIDNELKGDAKDRFMRQRLRAEFKWQWTPSKRLPQIKAILKLKSLSKDQKEEITSLMKKADDELLRLAAENLRKQDEQQLSGKDKENPWEYMQNEEGRERVKKEAKIRKELIKDVVNVLDDNQKTAYETGIENDQDLADAFEKRRYGTEAWGLDQELTGWDWTDMRGEDEEEQK
ncbi:MAG: hypothetical protein U0640_02805 [Phycisphaerales bacterium]